MPTATHLAATSVQFTPQVQLVGTPVADSLIVVTVLCSSDFHSNAFSWTISDTGSRTWTPQGTTAAAGSGTRRAELRCWTAPAGSSPTSTTITVDGFATGDGLYVAEAQCVANVAGTPIAQTKLALATSGAAAATFDAAPANYQTAVAVVECVSTTPTFGTAPAGFTTINTTTVANPNAGGVRLLDSATNTTAAVSQSLTAGDTQFIGIALIEYTATSIVDQTSGRWGNDDGTESGHTFAAAQDANLTAALGTKLLRVVLNATSGDPPAFAPTLRYQKNGAGGYTVIPVGSAIAEVFGTVTFGAVGTGANGSTTVAPSYPTGITAGQYLLCHVTSGATNSETPSTPSGWTLLATGASTDGTFGVDTGPRRATVFGKVADGTETGTLTVSITNGNTCRGTISRWTKSAGNTWDVVGVGANDSTSGTGVSMTFGSVNWHDGDAVAVVTGQRVDSATLSAQSLTATGITFGARTNQADTAVTTGNDHRHVVDTFAAVTGADPSEAAAPTWAYTASAAVSAGGVLVRLRGYTAPGTNEVYIAPSANIAAGGEATTNRLTIPQTFTTGRRWKDENGTDTIDLATAQSTELEWAVAIQSPGTTNDFYDFRIYEGTLPADTYTFTPRWTIGTGGTNAPAGAATVTTTAVPATTTIRATPSTGAVTLAAQGPIPTVRAVAGLATVGVAAAGAAGAVRPTAAPATVTVTAFDPTANTGSSTLAPAGLATATVTASNTTGQVRAAAGPATITAAAVSPTTSVQPTAGPANVAVAASNPSATVSPTAGTANVTVSGSNPASSVRATALSSAVSISTPAPMATIAPTTATAAVTATGAPASTTIRPTAQPAAVTVAGQGATVSTSSQTNAPAGAATVTATAVPATTTIRATPATATVAVDTALAATSIRPTAAATTVTTTAQPATATTSATTAAPAGLALVAIQGRDPSTTVRANAGPANVTDQGFGPAAVTSQSGMAHAGLATVTATAWNTYWRLRSSGGGEVPMLAQPQTITIISPAVGGPDAYGNPTYDYDAGATRRTVVAWLQQDQRTETYPAGRNPLEQRWLLITNDEDLTADDRIEWPAHPLGPVVFAVEGPPEPTYRGGMAGGPIHHLEATLRILDG